MLTHIPFEHLSGRDAGHGSCMLQKSVEDAHDKSAHLYGVEEGHAIDIGHCLYEHDPSTHLIGAEKGHPFGLLHFD